MTKVLIPWEVDTQELWENVFGSDPTSFGSHWAYWEYFGDTDWDVIGDVDIAMTDPDDENSAITRRIGIAELVEALPQAHREVYMDLFNFEEYDSVCADAILQVAVLGSVVYG